MNDEPSTPPPLPDPAVIVERTQNAVWGPGSAFAVLGVYLGAQFFSAIIVAIAVGVFIGISTASRHEHFSPAALQAAIFMPTVVVSVLVSSCGAFAFSLVRGRSRLRVGGPTGFGLVKVDTRVTIAALLAGVALSCLFTFVAPLIVPPPSKEAMGPLSQMALSPGMGRYAWLFIALLVAPLTEEYLFRGVLASGLRTRFGAATTISIVTVLFTLMHVTEAKAYWPAFLSIAALGVLAGVARERFGSLVPAMAAHFGYNAVIATIVLIS
ncbi:hypothetical protein BH11VER1_BH11VER1_40020 [soil metagenome]